MKSAPFSVTPILMTTLLAGALAGAVVGAVLAGLGFTSWPLGALCGLLPGLVVNPIRASMEQGMAELVGSDASRFRFDASSCAIIALVAAIVSAFLIIYLVSLPLGAASGGMIGVLSGSVIAFAMTVRRLAD